MTFYYTDVWKEAHEQFQSCLSDFQSRRGDQTDYKSHTAKAQLRMRTLAAPLNAVHLRLVEEAGMSQKKQAGLWGSL